MLSFSLQHGLLRTSSATQRGKLDSRYRSSGAWANTRCRTPVMVSQQPQQSPPNSMSVKTKLTAAVLMTVASLVAVRKLALMMPLVAGSSSSLAMVLSPLAPLAFVGQARSVVGFWFGEYLMWSPIARFLALIVICVGFAQVGAFMFKFADPSLEEVDAPLWRSIRAIVNPFEDDFAGVKARFVSSFLAGIGTIFFGILVGMVTSTVEDVVNSYPNMRIPSLVSNHLVVSGWNSGTPLALGSVMQTGSKVAVLTTRASDEVIGEIRDKMENSQNGKVYVRAGNPMLKGDLDRVRILDAKTLILVPEATYRENPKTKEVLSKSIALRGNLSHYQGHIIALVNDVEDESVIGDILGETSAKSVQIVNTNKLLGRFLAQAVLQEGLFNIVSAMTEATNDASFNLISVKTVAPQLAGKNFATIDKYESVPGSVVAGYVGSDGVTHIASQDDFMIKPQTKLIIFGNGKGITKTHTMNLKRFSTRPTDVPETVLVCGWRNGMIDMLSELDQSLPPKSKIIVVADNAVQDLPKKLTRSNVVTVHGKWSDSENLDKAFNKGKVDKVVVLANNKFSSEHAQEESDLRADTNSLAGLAYIENRIRRGDAASDVSVSVEFWDERMREITQNSDYGNVVFPSELGARIISEAVRDPLLNPVWNELLSQYGREITLRPMGNYTGESAVTSFSQIAKIAVGRDGETAVGYITSTDKVAHLNPQGQDKNAPRAWSSNDVLITLSEN